LDAPEVEQGHLQMSLFDERNLLEPSSPDYPGERLVACRKEALAKLRAHKREDLLAATERNRDKVKARIECMLAYDVERHLREAWREWMFADTEQHAKASRDPVAPAERSPSAQQKAAMASCRSTGCRPGSAAPVPRRSVVDGTCRPHSGWSRLPGDFG
jgi:hypothetical protein